MFFIGLYPPHMSEWMIDPGFMNFLMTAVHTEASRCCTTTHAVRRCLVLSTIPMTHEAVTLRPLLYFRLPILVSSTSTMIGSPFSSYPPSMFSSLSWSNIWATICRKNLCHFDAVSSSHTNIEAVVVDGTLFNQSQRQCITSFFGNLQP